jgi:hypothetical protein
MVFIGMDCSTKDRRIFFYECSLDKFQGIVEVAVMRESHDLFTAWREKERQNKLKFRTNETIMRKTCLFKNVDKG